MKAWNHVAYKNAVAEIIDERDFDDVWDDATQMCIEAGYSLEDESTGTLDYDWEPEWEQLRTALCDLIAPIAHWEQARSNEEVLAFVKEYLNDRCMRVHAE